MYFDRRHIIAICIFSLTVIAAAASAKLPRDTVGFNPHDSWYKNLARSLKNPLYKDPDLLDSMMKEKGKNYWKWAAMNGMLDLKDKNVQYPKFIKFCVDTYNWGDRTFNSYDSAYVVGTGKRWKLFGISDNWLNSYAMHFRKGSDINMMSNLSCNLGGEIAYMAVSAAYMIDLDHLIGNKPVTHKKFDLSFTCALFAGNFSYSRNNGTTQIKKFGDYRDGKWISHKFDGLTLESYELDVYYFLNNKKYSQGAAYCFSKIQKRSAGSAIFGITMSSQDVNIDFTDLPAEMLAQLPDNVRQYRFRYNDYCFLLGYGYNWVLPHHFLLNFSGMPSVGLRHTLQNSLQGRDNLVSLNLIANTSLIYNKRNFFAGFFGKFNGHFYISKKCNFFNSVEVFNISTGIRF